MCGLLFFRVEERGGLVERREPCTSDFRVKWDLARKFLRTGLLAGGS